MKPGDDLELKVYNDVSYANLLDVLNAGMYFGNKGEKKCPFMWNFNKIAAKSVAMIKSLKRVPDLWNLLNELFLKEINIPMLCLTDNK